MKTKIKLIAKSKKGKEKIAKWGNIWHIRYEGFRMQIVADTDPNFDNLMTTPDSARWIFTQDDVDFTFEFI